MIGCDPPVVCAGHHQDRGVVRAIDDMVIWRIRVERLELVWIFYRSEFRDIESAVRGELDPEHVVNAD
jgi:hypothetical protein